MDFTGIFALLFAIPLAGITRLAFEITPLTTKRRNFYSILPALFINLAILIRWEAAGQEPQWLVFALAAIVAFWTIAGSLIGISLAVLLMRFGRFLLGSAKRD